MVKRGKREDGRVGEALKQITLDSCFSRPLSPTNDDLKGINATFGSLLWAAADGNTILTNTYSKFDNKKSQLPLNCC